jgi:uncharacterized protein (DUF488 family)
MTPPDQLQFLTVGHSNHAFDDFVVLLQRHRITAVADVRSAPYSRHHPQFNRETLRKSLREHEVAYVYLGAELGARSKDRSCYVDGRVQYSRLAATQAFQGGIARLREGAKIYRIAIMCAEKDPLDCHRTLLVARVLERDGASISHIRGDGSLESNHAAMLRLVDTFGLPRADMFRTERELIDAAAQQQEARIAYVDETFVRGEDDRS